MQVVENKLFTDSEIKIGINLCKNRYVRGRSLYDIIKYYDMPASWYREGKVYCLDELELFTDVYESDSDDMYSDEPYTNSDFKWDIEEAVHTGSCYGLSVYIFQLIQYIQNNH